MSDYFDDEPLCSFRQDGDYFIVNFKFNRELIDAIKQIPHQLRKWEKTKKCWRIHKSVAKKAVEYAEELDFVVTFYPESSDPRVTTTQQRPAAPPSLLFKYASDAELLTLYRAIVFRNHPDRGGTNEAMWEINSAWESLKKSRTR